VVAVVVPHHAAIRWLGDARTLAVVSFFVYLVLYADYWGVGHGSRRAMLSVYPRPVVVLDGQLDEEVCLCWREPARPVGLGGTGQSPYDVVYWASRHRDTVPLLGYCD